MKRSGKIFICISSVLAVLACLAGFYLLSEIKGNDSNSTAAGSDEIVDTGRDEYDEFILWKEEF